MLKTYLLLALLAITCNSFAQATIDINDATKHLGDSVTICAKVFGVKATEKITFINVGAPYPNAPLTVVIFAKDYPKFNKSIPTFYDNKLICITGVLKEYKGKIQIEVADATNILVK